MEYLLVAKKVPQLAEAQAAILQTFIFKVNICHVEDWASRAEVHFDHHRKA
jgi:hypothetical protein